MPGAVGLEMDVFPVLRELTGWSKEFAGIGTVM